MGEPSLGRRTPKRRKGLLGAKRAIAERTQRAVCGPLIGLIACRGSICAKGTVSRWREGTMQRCFW